MTKKKTFPTYETKVFECTIVVDPATGKKRISIDHERFYLHELSKFKLGEKVLMKITNKKRKRSMAQNSYMHLYFSLIALSSGHTAKEIKSWAKGKFLSKGITEVFGDKVRKVDETSELTIGEMMEFVDRVEAHTGIPAPDPEPFNLGITNAEYRELKAKQAEKYSKMEAKLG